MTPEALALLGTAIFLGVTHTLIGIDHYVPFVALSKANSWSMKKTMLVVFICGVGHVLASVVLGFLGVAFSWAVSSMESIESSRGAWATYFLLAFGLVYTIYGIRCAVKNKAHKHVMPNGTIMEHFHQQKNGIENAEQLSHQHETKRSTNIIWGLFVLLILGPCEPLIPILMYPAATQNISVLILITLAFSFFTIATMMTATFIGLKGISLLRIKSLERYSHALAGLSILFCGILLTFCDI